MKSKLGLVLLALSAPAFAAQSTRLGDLNFFPKDNSIYWNTQLSQTNQDFKNSAGTNSFDNENSVINWQNTVLYALNDSFNVGASFDYDIRNRTENTRSSLGTKNKDFESTGVSDLTLNANYRLLQEKFYLDLIGALTLGIGDKEGGVATQTKAFDGNNKQGHHSVLLGLAGGQKISDFEWRAKAFFDYHLSGERTTYDFSNNKLNLDTDSYNVMGLDLRGQYRFMKNFAVEAMLGFNRVSEQSESGNVSGVSLDNEKDSFNFLQYGLTGKYNVSDALLVKAGIAMTGAREEKGTSKQAFNPATSTKLEYESARSLFLGGEFLF